MFVKEFHENLAEQPLLLKQAACLLQEHQSFCWVIQNEGDLAYTYRMVDDNLTVIPKRTAADLVLGIDPYLFIRLATQEITLEGLIQQNRIEFIHGTLEQIGNWFAVMQVLFYHHKVWSPAVEQTLSDIDLNTRFRFTDPLEEVRKFLDKTGFVVFKQIFAFAELNVIRERLDELMHDLHEDNPRAHWAETASGDKTCHRLSYINQIDDYFNGLMHDPRFRQAASYATTPLIPAEQQMDGFYCEVQRSHIVDPIDNQRWHKDCDWGGHPVLCPGLVVGLHIDEATKESGKLEVLAGSHHYANTPRDPNYSPQALIAPDIQPGDVTLRYTHLLHRWCPPTGNHTKRRILYQRHQVPALYKQLKPSQHYRDWLSINYASPKRAEEASRHN